MLRLQKSKLMRVSRTTLQVTHSWVVRRPMHHTQSMLWELMDGVRNFNEICDIMVSLYHEDISPVQDRIKSYLEVFVRLNVATVLKPREEE